MHPDTAESLDDLGQLYHLQGVYREAEPSYSRALTIREKTLGSDNPEVANSLGNLARLYQDQEAYSKAEPLLIRSLGIREKALGLMHPDVAESLNNLAALYQAQGAYDKAEPLLVRAVGICEKALGPMHPHVAASLNNLARLYDAQGANGKAEPLYVRALNIYEKALGPMHPDVAANLNNLAGLYLKRRAYDKAHLLLVRSLAIQEKAKSLGHPDVATSLGNLAWLYLDQRAYSKAEPLLIRALAIREKALGPMHPGLAVSLSNLGQFYWAKGMYTRAEPLLARAAEIREQQLRIELVRLPESRKRSLIGLLDGETNSLVSLHIDAMPNSRAALALALTTVLRRKGRVLDSLVDHNSALRAHLSPALHVLFDQLSRLRNELVTRLYAPSGLLNTTDRIAIAEVRRRIDELESKLGAASAEYNAQSEPATLTQIQAALPPGTALVELVRYTHFDPAEDKRRWQDDRYVAYLVTRHGLPQWIALGAATSIDTEIDTLLATMHRNVSAEITRMASKRVDALVFAPLRARLKGASHIIVAADGKLNLVPFEALVDGDGQYALESFLFSYVTTGRDLVRFTIGRSARSPAVIVAAPDYGPLPSPPLPGAMSFAPLTGASTEATDLQTYFSTAPLTGGNASKSALAQLSGPAMLHIATHGFYARDAGRAPTATVVRLAAIPAQSVQRNALREMHVDSGLSLQLPPPRSDDLADALDRSGLAMAGANQGAHGIVTAREIAGFDWWGTQLVVLSACETGVGAVASGDGVYGLRRALVLAGAASQVVSLWSVNDTSTRVLMRDYYGELVRGTGRAEALRRAKLRLMQQPGYAHPYYWAAFIPVGDWRPLDKTGFSIRKPHP